MPTRHRFLFTTLLLIVPPLAEGGMPSTLYAAGKDSSRIAEVTWILLAGGAVIFMAMMLCAGIALFGSSAQRSALGRKTLVIGGGLVFPAAALSILMLYVFGPAAGGQDEEHAAQTRIDVIGELWWWRVRYLDSDGTILFETANEIRMPTDTPVQLRLTSAEVIHSFWVPALAGKIDMLPGRPNELRLHAFAPGVFRGQCAEYCGAQHAKMALQVVALAKPDYDAWFAAQLLPAPEARDPQILHGRRLFLDNHCGQCHTVRGTSANGRLGPDLTHVGSRLSLAAGTLPNNHGTLAGWIAGSQQIKPGNRMPSFNQFSGEELRALSAYLAHLE